MKWAVQTFGCDGLTWDELTGELKNLLEARAKSDDRYVIVSDDERHRFVQYATHATPGSVRCEAVSNQFLTASKRLTRGAIRDLVNLGWSRPNTTVTNFWRVYRSGVNAIGPATLGIRTMRDVFKTSDPGRIRISCGVFDTLDKTASGPDPGSGLPILAVDQEIVNHTTGTTYSVRKFLGGGGFGSTYQVSQSGGQRKLASKLCLKVSAGPEAWHREAYFGQLLQGVPRSIAVFDSFATFVTAPRTKPLPLYCLVTELAEYGDLFKYLRQRSKPWAERRACREVAGLLGVLIHLHEAGAVHRDLTPGNVLVCEGERLKLGDFGIARHRLSRRSIPADMFNPEFAPPAIADGNASTWRTADDVYQMGRILAYLLGADPDEPVNSTDIKALSCGSHVKAVIQRAIGVRRKRYQDAAAMLGAIEGMHVEAPGRSPTPESLKGKFIVFTGALSGMSRREAAGLAKRRGAHVQLRVTSRTDVVVRGAIAEVWKADDKGQKLLDVDRERERGHEVCVIDERQFLALLR